MIQHGFDAYYSELQKWKITVKFDKFLLGNQSSKNLIYRRNRFPSQSPRIAMATPIAGNQQLYTIYHTGKIVLVFCTNFQK